MSIVAPPFPFEEFVAKVGHIEQDGRMLRGRTMSYNGDQTFKFRTDENENFDSVPMECIQFLDSAGGKDK